jgi:hypothetical protein
MSAVFFSPDEVATKLEADFSAAHAFEDEYPFSANGYCVIDAECEEVCYTEKWEYASLIAAALNATQTPGHTACLRHPNGVYG